MRATEVTPGGFEADRARGFSFCGSQVIVFPDALIEHTRRDDVQFAARFVIFFSILSPILAMPYPSADEAKLIARGRQYDS